MSPRRLALASLLVVAPLLAGCPAETGFLVPGEGGEGDWADEDPYWCCDPDQPRCVCEGYWHCTEGVSGKRCEQDNPQLPDEGGPGSWDCEYRGDLIVCTGEDAQHPDAGSDGDWDCTRADGTVECSRQQDAGDLPDGEGDGPWDCAYSANGDLRSCESADETGDDGGDWDCRTSVDGTTICESSSPDRPDDGEWDCTQSASRDVCEGDHMPDGEGDGQWDCYQQGEIVRCQNDEPQQPDDGGDSPWNCEWNEGESIVCIQNGDDGPLGGDDDVPNDGDNPGDDDVPNDGDNPGDDDVPNDGGQDEPGCQCPPGAWRYCDTPTYCNWGTQECDDSSGEAEWTPCVEDAAPNGCFNGGMYDAEAEQCAIDSGYCAQDFWDLDWDGDTDETLGRDCGDLECVAPGDDGWGDWGDWF